MDAEVQKSARWLGAPGAEVVLLREEPFAEARFDLAISRAVLDRLQADGGPPVLRIHRPAPTLAFGRVDAFRPGFAAAVAVAADQGFEPVLRGPGGRAAAYHSGSLVIDLFAAEPDPRAGITGRFVEAVDLVVAALRRLGLEARAGELPGEYCPGAHSVLAGPVRAEAARRPGSPALRAGGESKLGGAAQRVVRGAAQVSLSLVAERSAPLRRLLRDVYGLLDYPLDPATVGAADDIVAGLTVDDLERAILAAWSSRWTLVSRAIDERLRAAARELEHEHRANARP